jgi:hypothetical protein
MTLDHETLMAEETWSARYALLCRRSRIFPRLDHRISPVIGWVDVGKLAAG